VHPILRALSQVHPVRLEVLVGYGFGPGRVRLRRPRCIHDGGGNGGAIVLDCNGVGRSGYVPLYVRIVAAAASDLMRVRRRDLPVGKLVGIPAQVTMADGALGYALVHGYRLPVALEKQTRIVA